MATQEIIIRLLLSALVGGIIGAEREYRNKSAGFRTLILISIGSCLFTILSMLIDENSKDRIASNIVTGIGFVGAGVIFKSENRVKGLTTAALVWVTAAIGMAIAVGSYLAAGVTSLVVLVVLFILSYVGKLLDRRDVRFRYKIVFHAGNNPHAEYDSFLTEKKLRSTRPSLSRSEDEIIFNYLINGSESAHDELLQKLLSDRRVKSFDSIVPN